MMAGEEKLVRLRDLPGVAHINDLCRNKRNFDYPTLSYTQAEIDVVSIRLFGITQRSTTWDAGRARLYDAYLDQFEEDDDDEGEDNIGDEETDDEDEDEDFEAIDFSAAKVAWEEKFRVTTMSLPASEPFWRAIGWDISDGSGDEMLCAYLFDRQIIATVGSLVPGAKLTLDGSGTWEGEDEDKEADLTDRLKREAEDFVQRKRSR